MLRFSQRTDGKPSLKILQSLYLLVLGDIAGMINLMRI